MTKENKNLTITAGIFLSFFLIIALLLSGKNINNTVNSGVYNNGNNSGDLVDTNVSLYNTVINSNKLGLIYIARPTCSYCQKFNPILTKVLNDYKVDAYYLNTDNLTSSEQSEVSKSMTDYFSKNGFSTPGLMITLNGKLVDSSMGLLTEEKLIAFLEKNNIIGNNSQNSNTNNNASDSSSSSEYLANVSKFTKIDINEYINLYKSNNKSIIYLGTKTCSACQTFSPTLKKTSEDRNLKIYYLDTETLSNDDKLKLVEYNSYIKEQQRISTPSIFIVGNNELIDTQVGAASSDKFNTFLDKNNM